MDINDLFKDKKGEINPDAVVKKLLDQVIKHSFEERAYYIQILLDILPTLLPPTAAKGNVTSNDAHLHSDGLVETKTAFLNELITDIRMLGEIIVYFQNTHRDNGIHICKRPDWK